MLVTSATSSLMIGLERRGKGVGYFEDVTLLKSIYKANGLSTMPIKPHLLIEEG